jgi:hypothetical protein
LSEISRIDVHDDDRTGRPNTSGTVVSTARVEELILENRGITIPDLFGALGGTQHCPRKQKLNLFRVKMFELVLKWDKRITVFPE